MPERDPVAADFVGKTIVAFEADSVNVWRFKFSDGTAIAIEADLFGYPSLPCMQVCDECAADLVG